MILCDTSLIDGYTKEGIWGQATLDALFRKNVRTHRDQIALSDPPSRPEFTCGPARRLTYGEADEIIDDLTAMFHVLGVERDDVIAVQMPNTIELPLLMLSCFRAGIILSILPPLWREFELEKALNSISPKVLITQPVEGDIDTLDLMREVAAKVYSVRHVLAFGDELPDGIVPIDKVIAFAKEQVVADEEPEENSSKITANDIAIITWNGVESPDLKALPRSHNHLISAGLCVLLEASLEDESSILCPFSLSSLAALGSFFVPWILTGGSFHIHQPFDLSGFKQQLELEKPTFTGLPPAALTRLCEDVNGGELDLACLKALACLWPTLGSANLTSNIDTYLLPPITDIFSIGELAIHAHRRSDNLLIDIIPHGECKFPSVSGNGPSLLFTRLKGCAMKNSAAGSMLVGQLMIKGPMIYEGDFQGEAGKPQAFEPLERDNQGFVATGIKCEIVDEGGPKLKPVERLSKIIYHGGLAVSASDLDTIYSEFSGIERAVAVSIPDPILGECIAAAVIPSSATDFSFDDFKSFLENRKLAPYKVPGRVIKVDEIALDEEGRVIRQNPEMQA
jgi:non-ribosomal peptide synthetase component E (peptide arylation enzyme)